MSDFLSQLKADEISALIAAITPPVTAIATGDGSTASVIGQGVALQGVLIANEALFQKIGVNDVAKAFLAWLQAQNPATKTAAAAGTPHPGTTPPVS